jgi:acyl transferase domain-containing protein
LLELVVASRDLARMALLWAHGIDVPWDVLYTGEDVRALTLPNYPFERRQYGAAHSQPDMSTYGVAVDVQASSRTESPATAAADPRTDLERVLADSWRDVLGVDHIGVNDGFMEIGGNSLTAVRVVSKLRQAFFVDVPLATLLRPSATLPVVAAEIVRQLARHADPAVLDASTAAAVADSR